MFGGGTYIFLSGFMYYRSIYSLVTFIPPSLSSDQWAAHGLWSSLTVTEIKGLLMRAYALKLPCCAAVSLHYKWISWIKYIVSLQHVACPLKEGNFYFDLFEINHWFAEMDNTKSYLMCDMAYKFPVRKCYELSLHLSGSYYILHTLCGCSICILTDSTKRWGNKEREREHKMVSAQRETEPGEKVDRHLRPHNVK